MSFLQNIAEYKNSLSPEEVKKVEEKIPPLFSLSPSSSNEDRKEETALDNCGEGHIREGIVIKPATIKSNNDLISKLETFNKNLGSIVKELKILDSKFKKNRKEFEPLINLVSSIISKKKKEE